MSFRELEDGEFVLDDHDEDVWRLVNPRHLADDGVPSSAAFSDKAKQLSVIRSAKRTAKQAYDHHRLSRECAGAWPVRVEVVDDLGLRAVDDSAFDPKAAPGHAYIDYRDIERADWVAARTALIAAAAKRGRSYPDS